MKKWNLHAKLVILQILVILVSSCAFFANCKPSFSIPVFMFNNDNSTIYNGPKDKPNIAVKYGDKQLDEFVALTLNNWEYVKVRCTLK